MTTLSKLDQEQAGRIVAILSGDAAASRLAAMGLVPGTHVRIVGVAPLGDPILIETEGC